MPNINPVDRLALGILSEAISAQLGASSKVTKEVRRAYVSGKEIDRFTARAAFDALPGWQRGLIDQVASEKAYSSIDPGLHDTAREWDTARDWRDLPAASGSQRSTAPRGANPGAAGPSTTGQNTGAPKASPQKSSGRLVIPTPPSFMRRNNDT
jgi:hypothetical protein